MFRCAELTILFGYDYFIIVRNETDSEDIFVTKPGTYVERTTGTVATAVGGMEYGSATTTGIYVPGQSIVFTKYGANATIKMFEGQKPVDNLHAYDAREVMGSSAKQPEAAVPARAGGSGSRSGVAPAP